MLAELQALASNTKIYVPPSKSFLPADEVLEFFEKEVRPMLRGKAASGDHFITIAFLSYEAPLGAKIVVFPQHKLGERIKALFAQSRETFKLSPDAVKETVIREWEDNLNCAIESLLMSWKEYDETVPLYWESERLCYWTRELQVYTLTWSWAPIDVKHQANGWFDRPNDKQ